jgi:hypothetical protein
MRKVLICLTVAAAALLGSSFAQGGYWAGFSVGYPGAALHFGIDGISPGLAARVNAGYNYIGTSFALGADLLYDLPVDTGTAPIDIYVGGGVGLGIGAGVNVAVNAFAGGEFSLSQAGLPEGGIFLEAGPSLGFSPFVFGVTAKLGFNYHF